MRYSKGISRSAPARSLAAGGLVIFALLLYVPAGAAGADDWQRLQNRAALLYGGWDVTVQVNAGLEHREYFEHTHTGPYGNVEMQVPLYSKKERIATATAKADFLQKGAELIRVLEEQKKDIVILEKKAHVLKSVMMDEGAKGIEAYYDVMESITKKEAEVHEARRKLEAMLKD